MAHWMSCVRCALPMDRSVRNPSDPQNTPKTGGTRFGNSDCSPTPAMSSPAQPSQVKSSPAQRAVGNLFEQRRSDALVLEYQWRLYHTATATQQREH